ncbi:helix-turn-helix domain-containing protein [Simiduia sp. 21SJ11W-1]|uniref:helix-turn-helix transcriptional regulator n=1 Tax=Simiduia sp. 21SJ11W-1 TaxID=2909669 RepID=UPI0020A0F1D7|nr:helix-turn-helix domain-containing protein [Simiduia sp. 21SJ11W-1]UTA49674.1 helix-turn-helix domain-containing protein [Simiduia sp. 21SJ11W-1]
MTERELCNRWQVSEATLERWRSEGIGPICVKLGGQVRYRREDVASCLRRSSFSRACCLSVKLVIQASLVAYKITTYTV